jgi:hypothetical protein
MTIRVRCEYEDGSSRGHNFNVLRISDYYAVNEAKLEYGTMIWVDGISYFTMVSVIDIDMQYKDGWARIKELFKPVKRTRKPRAK